LSKITVSLECGCFKKSGIKNNQTFENKEKAFEKATNMAKHMNETFCQKHNFSVKEDGDNILIEVKNNK
jgi:hypothetical protein